MRWRGSSDASATTRGTEMREAGQAQTAMKTTESMCEAGVRRRRPRFYNNLNMRWGGSDASAEEKAQEERVWRIDCPWTAERTADDGGGHFFCSHAGLDYSRFHNLRAVRWCGDTRRPAAKKMMATVGCCFDSPLLALVVYLIKPEFRCKETQLL